MIRILVVDDLENPEFIPALRQEIENETGQQVEAVHLNPTHAFTGRDTVTELKAFVRKVEAKAAEFWDVALIDVNLNDVNLPKLKKLHLALTIAGHFHDVNKAAVMLLYSGTLSEHVKELLGNDEPAEAALKRIYRSGIAAFVPRSSIRLQVTESLSSPPFLLRVDRALMERSAYVVKSELSEFAGKSLGQLATSVRTQDRTGMRFVSLITEHGVAALLDLNV